MPPIQVYAESPINATKADSITPKTSSHDSKTASGPSATTTSTVPPTSTKSSLAAHPGATATMPKPTAAVENLYGDAYHQPSPTQSIQQSGPPPPQPGAVPMAPGTKSPLPPPPKAGEKLQQQSQSNTPVTQMPPQWSYPPPNATYSGPTSSTVPISMSQPTFLQGSVDYSHPPGYQQDTYASEFSSHQRAAHNSSVMQQSNGGYSEEGGEGDGVWETAKKWATAAGDKLAAAENEVWKKINKN